MNLSLLSGMMLATVITACHTVSSTPSASEMSSPVASSSIASNPNSPVSTPSTSPIPSTSPTPSISPASSTSNDAASPQQAVQVIRDYYRAINGRDYETAYSAWDRDGAASQQSFEEFRQGFANTASVAVEVGEPGQMDGAAGSSYIEIPVTVTAVTQSGSPQRFRGSYVLRRVNDVPGSTPEQRRWHLYSATINQVN